MELDPFPPDLVFTSKILLSLQPPSSNLYSFLNQTNRAILIQFRISPINSISIISWNSCILSLGRGGSPTHHPWNDLAFFFMKVQGNSTAQWIYRCLLTPKEENVELGCLLIFFLLKGSFPWISESSMSQPRDGALLPGPLYDFIDKILPFNSYQWSGCHCSRHREISNGQTNKALAS